MGYSPWGHKASDTSEQLITLACNNQDFRVELPPVSQLVLLWKGDGGVYSFFCHLLLSPFLTLQLSVISGLYEVEGE